MGRLLSACAMAEYPKVFVGAACVSIHWPASGGAVIESEKSAGSGDLLAALSTPSITSATHAPVAEVGLTLESRGHQADHAVIGQRADGK